MLKFFGFNIGKTPVPQSVEIKQEYSNFIEIPLPNNAGENGGPIKQTFSTPFLKIPQGTLSAPFISPFYTVSGIVQFGSDNLFPQILDQLYYTSAIHGASINFVANATVGGGYEYVIPLNTGKEKVDMFTFEKVNKFKKIVRELAKDYLIHKRVTILITRDKKGKFLEMKRIHPAYIRNSQDLTKFVWCKDWSRRTGMVTYDRYNASKIQEQSLYVFQAETVGQDIYPLPSYISVLNDIYTDGEIAFLQKANIQNSIWPTVVIRNPKIFESEEEINAFKVALNDNSGAAHAGKILVLTGNGLEMTPMIQELRMNANDKLFDSTLDTITNKICIAWGLNPAIMGVKIQGSLGNATELQMSYGIFEKNIILPLRMEMEEIYDDLLDIAGIQNSIKLVNYQIIDMSIAEVPSIEDQINGIATNAASASK